MTADVYRFKIESHIDTFFNRLTNLQNEEEFVDLTLAAEDHIVQVHKNVVALASPYLKEMIKKAPNQSPIIFLNNVSHKVLGYMIEYIYTGETNVPHGDVKSFMQVCNNLHIFGMEGGQNKSHPRQPIATGNVQPDHVTDNRQSNYVTENNQTNFVTENSQTNFVTENIQTNFVTENNQTNFVIENTQTNFVTENNQTNFVTENSQTNFVTENNRTNFVAENSQTNFVTENIQTNFVTENNQTNFVIENTQTNFVTENNQTNFVTETRETNYIIESRPLDFVTDLTDIQPPNYLMDSRAPETENRPAEYVTIQPDCGMENSQLDYITENRQDDNLKENSQEDYGRENRQEDYEIVNNDIVIASICPKITDLIRVDTIENQTFLNINPIPRSTELQTIQPDGEPINTNYDENEDLNLDSNIPTFSIVNRSTTTTETIIESSNALEQPMDTMQTEENTVNTGDMGSLDADLINNIEIKVLDNVPMVIDNTPIENKMKDIDVNDLKRMAQYSVTERGSMHLILNRFMYCCHHWSRAGRKRRWRCIDYRSSSCKAFVDTNDGVITKRNGVHTHANHDKKIYKKHELGLIFNCYTQADNVAKSKLNAQFQ